ncbi:hypothetical protein [Persicimonas caeni]|uniref:hypothetical protein n=1 Tax=Persicimonas caeni TaxID=2292766 RepID=UPI00143CE515|nr:hypothetical protein [Persicimonas caeni]
MEPAIWTDRMLEALERGVKGGNSAYFANDGLFFMAEARRLELESLRKGTR